MSVVSFGPEIVMYDDGTLARNAGITVVERGTTTAITLYTDITGGTEADNPVDTDDDGNLLFYAEAGDYDVMFRGSRAPVAYNAPGPQGDQGERGPAGPQGTIGGMPDEWYSPPDFTLLLENALI